MTTSGGKVIKAHEQPIVDLGFSDQNSHLMVTASENEVSYWDLRKQEQKLFTQQEKNIFSVQFLKNNNS